MNKIIVDIFMYFFEAILLFYYANRLFYSNKPKAVQFLIIIIQNAILFGINQLNITYLNAVLFMLSYTIVFSVLYNASIKTAVLHSAMFVVIMFASEVVSAVICSLIFDNNYNLIENEFSQYVGTIVASKIIYSLIIIVILNCFIRKDYVSKNKSNKYFWMLFITPISSVLMLLSFKYIASYVELPRKLDLLWIISSIIALFANVFVFIAYERMQKNLVELNDLRVIQNREKQDKQYFEIIDKSNKEMRIFAHDTKNHLLQMRNLYSIEDVHNYIDKLTPNIEKFEQIGISKNKMLDLIISKYMTLCELKNIELSIDVKTANLSYIDDVDLSTLMNNLLDNAVEAAEKSSGGFIKIKIFSKNKMYDALIIQNSSLKKPLIENNKLLTSKHDRKIHGIGISSVKRVLKKYDAVYDWSYFEDLKVFQTDIAFPKR